MLDKVNKILFLCQKNKFELSIAESCTGGLISSIITSVSGVSVFFKYGWVVYSNEAKINCLGVNKSLIDKYGVVSKQVAEEMVIGALKKSSSNFSLSTTGFLDLTSNIDGEKNLLGTVFFGMGYKENNNFTITSHKKRFLNTRQENQKNACYFAIDIILEFIRKVSNIAKIH